MKAQQQRKNMCLVKKVKQLSQLIVISSLQLKFFFSDCDYNGLGRSHSSQVNEFFERHSLQSKRNFAEFSEPPLKLCCYSKELDSYMEMPLNKLEEYTKRMMPSFAPPRSNNNVLSDESDSNE